MGAKASIPHLTGLVVLALNTYHPGNISYGQMRQLVLAYSRQVRGGSERILVLACILIFILILNHAINIHLI